MRAKAAIWCLWIVAGCLSAQTPRQAGGADHPPRAYLYREVEGQKLRLFVFPAQGDAPDGPTAAVLLFHGGAWVMGSADWTFTAARRFAARGLTAVSVDYRLSRGKDTPVEAVDDARAAVRWVRRHAEELNIDPKRIAGYGVSAGGQLVAVAAMVDVPGDGIDGTSPKPDVLLLWSPAVFAPSHLLPPRENASFHSPMDHAGAATPPTCIVNGDRDTVTPLTEAAAFRDRVVRAGGICELHVYPGVGHLLTRNLANQLGDFDPDPRFVEDGHARLFDFLKARGYVR